MRIKITLKKLKRGDVVSIDWIDAGDLDDSPSSWFSEADAEKVFKERYPWKLLRSILGTEKKIYFWCVMLKDKTSKVLISMVLALFR